MSKRRRKGPPSPLLLPLRSEPSFSPVLDFSIRTRVPYPKGSSQVGWKGVRSPESFPESGGLDFLLSSPHTSLSQRRTDRGDLDRRCGYELSSGRGSHPLGTLVPTIPPRSHTRSSFH